jgi:hypothetical protein
MSPAVCCSIGGGQNPPLKSKLFVILITQSIMRLDTAVRALVEWSYVYRKINIKEMGVMKHVNVVNALDHLKFNNLSHVFLIQSDVFFKQIEISHID